jgi:hypothetical protein
MSRLPFEWVRDKRHRRSNLRLIRHAGREKWLIPREHRPILVGELSDLFDSEDVSPRESIILNYAVLEMERTTILERIAAER